MGMPAWQLCEMVIYCRISSLPAVRQCYSTVLYNKLSIHEILRQSLQEPLVNGNYKEHCSSGTGSLNSVAPCMHACSRGIVQ